MKRFYCTVCKRIKRVQQWPEIIENPDAIVVKARQGECNRHSGNVASKSRNVTFRKVTVQTQTKTPTSQNKRKVS